MATLNFYRSRPKEKISGIYFRLNYGAFEIVNGKKIYRPFKYYIDESIDKDNWNNGKARAKKEFPQHIEFNHKLKRIEDKALSILLKMQNEGAEINDVTLKAALDKELKAAKDFTPDVNTHLVAFVEDYIKTCKKNKSAKNQYKLALNNFIEYEKQNNIHLRLLGIDMNFYYDFVDFLLEKDYAPNTIGNRIKNLKTFLKAAFGKKIPVCMDFMLDDFKKITEDVHSVYLTEDELMQMYRLDLKDDPYKEKTRDLFLIGAYTGFRYSDFSTLRKENFCMNDIIQKRTIKTGQDVVVPIHPIVQSIFKKYDNQIPTVSYIKFNKTIKEVVKAAKIEYDIHYIQTRGGTGEAKVEPKWKRVGSHTARRSFATNAYLAGVPTISIMKMTGHKTESSFMKYIKITLEENAKKLQNHTFFSKVPDAV